MLERYRSDPATLERLRNEPLGPYLDSYLASLESDGYARSTVRSQMGLLSHLSRLLAQKKFTICDLNEQCVEALVGQRRRQNRLHKNDPTTARHFLNFLRRTRVIPTPESGCEQSPLDQLVGRFSQYLTLQRGLTKTTVDNYCPFVSRFLVERFGNESLRLRELESSNVSSFILRQAPSQSLGRAKLMVASLRSFFRFLLQHGEILVDLGACVPSVADWRRSTVPKYLTSEEVERVLAACHRSTSMSRRDYVILLLLARLGLRAGEVVGLELDDIDWRSSEIVVSGKGLVRDRLPLLHEVGEELATYVHRDRPQSNCRRVFIRARAPHRGFVGPSAVSTIAQRAIARAGLSPPTKGAHIFRHSLATGMLRRGASMAEIGQILRHQVPGTTEIYAKVDFDGLRGIAQPWPDVGDMR